MKEKIRKSPDEKFEFVLENYKERGSVFYDSFDPSKADAEILDALTGELHSFFAKEEPCVNTEFKPGDSSNVAEVTNKEVV